MTFRINESDTLSLPLRWSSFSPEVQWTMIVLAALIPLLLIVWLYRYEMRLVSKGAATSLLVLRLLVLLIIWGLVSFQPTFRSQEQYEVPGKVLVMLDVSESMDVSDPQRTDEEKLRLIRALARTDGFNADVVNNDLLQEWIESHRDNRPIQWMKPGEHQDNPQKQRELAQQRQDAHEQLLDRAAKITRGEIARRILVDDKGINLAAKIGEGEGKHKIEARKFARGVDPLDLAMLKQELENPPKPAPKPPKKNEDKNPPGKDQPSVAKKLFLRATSRFASTDLNQPLIHATQWSTSEQGDIVGVVLLTDGRHNGLQKLKRRLASQLRRGRTEGVPLYPIALGSRAKPIPPDVTILNLDAPTTILKNSEINVQARFRVSGLQKQKLKVVLLEQGKDKPLEEREVDYDPLKDGHVRNYYKSFTIRMVKPGMKVLTLKVLPQGENVKEASVKNNEISTVLTVADDHADVLVIDGEARWEFHYLFNALLRDPTMRDKKDDPTVKGVVFIQPRLGNVSRTDLDKMHYPALQLPKLDDKEKKNGEKKDPKDADEDKDETVDDPLYKYDCIILGDVIPELLPLADRERLEKYVGERGGTLVILAGKRGMPMRYFPKKEDGKNKDEDRERDAEKDPLLRMLPIVDPKDPDKPKNKDLRKALDAGIHVSLTELGKYVPYLQMEHNVGIAENDNRWASFKPHYWAVPGEAKDSATALAYLRGDEKDLTADQIRERENKNALIVVQTYGFGEVLYVGLDSTWRWRYRIGDNYHHRFWGQTIRWAASDKPLIAGNRKARFGTPKPIYRHDQAVEVLVRLDEAARELKEQDKRTARARIYRKLATPDAAGKTEELVAFLELKPRLHQPNLLIGRPSELGPGEYEIELDVPKIEKDLKRKNPKTGKMESIRAPFLVAGRDDREHVELAPDHDLLRDLARANGSIRVYYPEDASELVEKLRAKTFVKKPEPKETRLWLWWPTLVLILVLLTIEWIARKLAGLP